MLKHIECRFLNKGKEAAAILSKRCMTPHIPVHRNLNRRIRSAGEQRAVCAAVSDDERPPRVTIAADGITVEAGKSAEVSQETCAVVQASKFQGGFVNCKK